MTIAHKIAIQVRPAEHRAPRRGSNFLETLSALSVAALTLVGIHEH
jgi:hypothetical protein